MSKFKTLYTSREPSQGLTFTQPSMTQQQFKDECDIDKLVKYATQTGDYSAFQATAGDYIDTSDVGDYKTALDFINDVNNEFYELPSDIRFKFDNDPSKYIDFMSDPNNFSEAAKLGIISGENLDASLNSQTDTPAVAPEAKPDLKAEAGTVST